MRVSTKKTTFMNNHRLWLKWITYYDNNSVTQSFSNRYRSKSLRRSDVCLWPFQILTYFLTLWPWPPSWRPSLQSNGRSCRCTRSRFTATCSTATDQEFANEADCLTPSIKFPELRPDSAKATRPVSWPGKRTNYLMSCAMGAISASRIVRKWETPCGNYVKVILKPRKYMYSIFRKQRHIKGIVVYLNFCVQKLSRYTQKIQ